MNPNLYEKIFLVSIAIMIVHSDCIAQVLTPATSSPQKEFLKTESIRMIKMLKRRLPANQFLDGGMIVKRMEKIGLPIFQRLCGPSFTAKKWKKDADFPE